MEYEKVYGCGLVDKGWEIGIVKVMGKEKKMVSVKGDWDKKEEGVEPVNIVEIVKKKESSIA